MLARLVLLVASLLVCAWLALGVFQTHDEAHAEALLGVRGRPSPATTARILHLLDEAGTLNPDRLVDLLRAQALVVADQRAAAERVALAVVHAEPQNVDAWIVLAVAATPGDPQLAQLAVAKRRQLVPPVRRAP
jgi:hypothetical protein